MNGHDHEYGPDMEVDGENDGNQDDAMNGS